MKNLLVLTLFSTFILTSCGGGSDASVSDGDENPTVKTPSFVVASRFDDVGGVSDAGSVIMINAATGVQIGTTLSGDAANDFWGSSGVTVLSNGNVVIASPFDDVGGVSNAGSVIMINAATGVQIGTTLSGDDANDELGSSSVTSLSNGNFVIASSVDDVAGVINAGSVMLINGATGVQIGATISGNNTSDRLGSSSVTALPNGNFVIASANDDVAGLLNAGSVMLINGETGVQIGTTLSGDDAIDSLGDSGVTALPNGNFVIASSVDDVAGVIDAGSVMLINAATGVQIGTTLSGDDANDELASSSVTSLSNGNFVIASSVDDVAGVINAGSVMLINGATGVQVGTTLSGDAGGDSLGSSGVTALPNGNFVIASSIDDVGGVSDAGSVMLINGATGVQIGTTLSGDDTNDYLGSSGVAALQ